jgi:hypothetical protein
MAVDHQKHQHGNGVHVARQHLARTARLRVEEGRETETHTQTDEIAGGADRLKNDLHRHAERDADQELVDDDPHAFGGKHGGLWQRAERGCDDDRDEGARPIFTRVGSERLPSTGAVATSARIRTNGHRNAVSQAFSWA